MCEKVFNERRYWFLADSLLLLLLLWMYFLSLLFGAANVPFNTNIQDFDLKISGYTISFGLLFVGRILSVGDLNAALNRQPNRKINARL